MIIYQSTKSGFVNDVITNSIADNIHRAYKGHLGRRASESEYKSWENSMQRMSNIVLDENIPSDAGITIEYQIPLTSKRIDFLLSGYDEAKRKQVVIVELKQWEKVKRTEKEGIVRTWLAKRERETTHPSYQAWSYAAILQEYNATVREKNIGLNPCAYLHNCSEKDIIMDPFYSECTDRAPAFLKDDAINLRNFIKKFIKKGDNQEIAYEIENGRLQPSKHLADTVESMLQGNREFILLDSQKVIYEEALMLASKASVNRKQVLIVKGGPGTGKSVIAINLLAELVKRKQLVKYISKNAAPRAVYSVKLKGGFKKNVVDSLFGGTGSYFDSDPNTFDVLVVDEAHRLNLKSGLYQNKGNNQIEEIINASKVSIFFVDDHQKVHIKDIGTSKSIEDISKKFNAKISYAELDSQFRCNGADGYLAWLDNMLGIKDTANITLSTKDYDFKVFDNPDELVEAIKEKNKKKNNARIVAGYCWNWVSKKKPELYDITLPPYKFKMRWNLTKDGSTWIIAPNSINEAGCIHTCQGLELDYVGVIVGNDITYNKDHVITNPSIRASSDKSLIGFKKRMKEKDPSVLEETDEIIKNTYRTLMTRGMKGCYVYFCDKALAEYFKSMIIQDEKPEQLEMPIEVEKETEVRIEPEVNENVKFIDFLPVYSLKAACGYFGDGELVEESGWVEVDGIGRLNRNMFVVQAVGHSMEPRINDRDYCVFNRAIAGSREGKIVLVQHNNNYDRSYEGSYSIKEYHSQKSVNPETGEWEHSVIELKPLNSDFNPIIINQDDTYDESYRIIGEFVGVVEK